jgi:hypothetical protein
MVTHTPYQCAFDEWAPLLAACHDYATLTGWRFVKADFMQINGANDAEAVHAARERACANATKSDARVGEQSRLLAEYHACQRLVASEAVYNSMVSTLKAVGLGGFGVEEAGGDERQGSGGAEGAAVSQIDEADAYAYQDMSQPIEVIARRLRAHHLMMEASPAMRDERRRRAMHATFVVEFGLEEGLPVSHDNTSEATLKDFLERLGEWEGARDSEVVRSLVLRSIPAGPAQQSLRETARTWFEKNRGAAMVGGAIVGGVLGLLVASAGLAIASRGAKK